MVDIRSETGQLSGSHLPDQIVRKRSKGGRDKESDIDLPFGTESIQV